MFDDGLCRDHAAPGSAECVADAHQIDSALSICGEQGWIDRQMIQSLVLLNLIGGDCVTDIEKLEADSGLCQMVRAGEYSGMSL